MENELYGRRADMAQLTRGMKYMIAFEFAWNCCGWEVKGQDG